MKTIVIVKNIVLALTIMLAVLVLLGSVLQFIQPVQYQGSTLHLSLMTLMLTGLIATKGLQCCIHKRKELTERGCGTIL
ncbi:hypothetical protein [Halobacillus sp. A5]|uniref:hypothetical protein n=1 Tax=Halobacillus sp. A5 TaxID=2880263 RepID=UPI0020A6520C|nr:hypothetical protein [Halobacillus sp. A5]MCP3027112.1 hypothetical protein [Halobacillus sp. A5]